jgi:hypothetical protein
MNTKRVCIAGGLVLTLIQSTVYGMGLRSFVALPVEKNGTVLRSIVEHNTDNDTNNLTANMAYGVSHTQTLLMGLPYRLSSGDGDSLGDAGILYRHIVRQQDTAVGTQRVGLLGGVIVPTDGDRDNALQAGTVYTLYRGQNEIDIDVLYQQGLGNRNNAARYDLSWQHRISPTEYPEWGIPKELYVVTEIGGRWKQGNRTVNQFTLGLQWVIKRWVIEGGAIKDLNALHQTSLLFSVRFH